MEYLAPDKKWGWRRESDGSWIFQYKDDPTMYRVHPGKPTYMILLAMWGGYDTEWHHEWAVQRFCEHMLNERNKDVEIIEPRT